MKIALGFLLSIAAVLPAFACSCGSGGPFLAVAQNSDLIVYGKVVSHEAHGMDFEVLESYKGFDSRQVIRIWGDNGAQCRPYISKFPVGTQWLLALSPVRENRERSQPDYAISSCGEFALAVTGGTVYLFDQFARTRLSEVAAKIRAWNPSQSR
jgi:hypothetical protein